MRFLITGGAGFIGSSLALKLSKDVRNTIVIVDNLLTGKLQYIPNSENVIFYNGSVNDSFFMQSIFLKHQFDFVFHYAAVVGVQRTLSEPITVLSDTKGLQNIYQLSALTGVKRFFYASSSEVYGEPVHIPQREEVTPLNSRLPYAVVKNLGEMFAKSYFQSYGLPYTILRFFNTYGPRQSEDFVISRFLKAAINNTPLTIYGDGSQSRTFCYIDDNIDTTLAILEKANAKECLTVNVGSDLVYDILTLAKEIISITKSKSEIIFLPPLKEGDMKRRQPCINIMKNFLKRPLISLEEGLGIIYSKLETNN